MHLKHLARDALVKLARTRSYELIPSYKMDEVPLVTHLRKLFALHQIDLVIDVGGNKGQYRDLLRDEVGFDGEILSFEPVARYHTLLRERARADPRWRIFDVALGSADGEAQINVTRSPGLNSFLPMRTDVVEGYWANEAVVAVETVQIRPLDAVLAEAGIDCSRRAVYLKLDTQGFDLEVVKGAPATLAQLRGLQTEASFRPIYQGMPTYADTLALLTASGFDLSGVFPVNHDKQLRLIEMDFLFVRHGA